MMTMMDSAFATGVRSMCGGSCSSFTISNYCRFRSSDDSPGVHGNFRRLPQANSLDVPWTRALRLADGVSFTEKKYLLRRSRVQATEGYSGSTSDPLEYNRKSHYHPFEDIAESMTPDVGDGRLTAAETTRTIVEVNTNATLMFSALVDDDIHENIFWPELPYVTDEHGNIYFRVSNDEDIMQTLTSKNNFVQVIIGIESMEMLSGINLSGPADIDFGIEEITEECDEEDDDNDDDDGDYDKDWVGILEDEEDVDSDETIGNWGNLETLHSSHPIYFANKLAEAASELPMDRIDQPPAGLAIQGLLRPSFVEKHSLIQKQMPGNDPSVQNQVGELEDELEDIGMLNGRHHESTSFKHGRIWAEGPDKVESIRPGTSFYKLEMIKIQLILSHGLQTIVEVNDFWRARPDAIAHSAAKIISRLKAGGEETTEALKSLCWRCKGIKVEEATLIALDSFGFDLRVCSGTQVQTLRFTFHTRVISEYSAEKQLNDLLFPRVQQAQKWQQPHWKEC